MRGCLLILAALVAAAHAQPFTFPVNASYANDLSAPLARNATGYSGLVFDFAKGKKADGGTPGGAFVSNQAAQNPLINTLEEFGMAQTEATLGPCAINPIHVHPRSSELTYVVSGSVETGIIEENGGTNTAVLRNASAGSTITFPQGLLHWQYNNNCEPAKLISTFADKDPGTATTWASLVGVPNNVLAASTGIHERTWARLKSFPLIVGPPTGGTTCLRRCGLSFAEANVFKGGVRPKGSRRRGDVVGVELDSSERND